ncbi:hypothetical protein GCM10009000_074300 [Halobacterium noricense]|uniref:Uncharacterized protein n=1 Tax=Haladaptatus pallidirubidus TaxID=1008152 RepID=A0AAV3UM15_9EURY
MARGQLATSASGVVEHVPYPSHPGSGRISYEYRYPLHYIPNNADGIRPNGVKRLDILEQTILVESGIWVGFWRDIRCETVVEIRK